jgi:hypothetical protein
LLHSGGATIRGAVDVTYDKELWGTAQWKLLPDSQLPSLGFAPLKNLAGRLATGLTSHEALATAWELTPWSWLADWFGNVGDVIAATNNSVGLTWSKIALMRRSFSRFSVKVNPALSDSWPKIDSDWVVDWTRKERYPAFPVIPFPTPTLPVLTGKHLSILASLAVLRR